MSDAEFIFRSMNTHQVLIILVVDTRVLGCVTNSLQKRRFASVSSTDYKDTKTSIFRSEVIGITIAHGRCGWGVKRNYARGNSAGNIYTAMAEHVPRPGLLQSSLYSLLCFERFRPRGKYQVCTTMSLTTRRPVVAKFSLNCLIRDAWIFSMGLKTPSSMASHSDIQSLLHESITGAPILFAISPQGV